MADGTQLNTIDARHLLRRTGFGAPPDDVADFATMTRGEAVARLLDFEPSRFRPGGKYINDAHNKWIKYMVKTRAPLQEKLVLFWHDHFATGFAKVQDVKHMALQNQTLRLNCKGNFAALVKTINKDPAMMEYLDTVRNGKYVPNENYARELQELFTLGAKDPNGNDNYTQEDIVQIARAFTGWRYDNNAGPYLDTDDHDFLDEFGDPPPDGRGPKVIYTSTGGFGGAGVEYAGGGSGYSEGETEIDTVVDIILTHTHVDPDLSVHNTVARRTARRLIEYFAHPDPDQTFVDDVIVSSGFDSTWDISALLHQIFVHDWFYESGIPGSSKQSVKWPVDYVVSSLRLLRMKLKGRYQYVNGGSYNSIYDQLTNMGQVALDPPSVFGWDWEQSWVSSATLLARYGFARDLGAASGVGGTALRSELLFDLSMTAPGDIVDAVTDLLGVKDYLSSAERTILMDYLTNNGALTPDLNDYDYRVAKLHGLIALVMQSPAYQLH